MKQTIQMKVKGSESLLTGGKPDGFFKYVRTPPNPANNQGTT